ncbi:hypothetical protein [Streptomyces sp. NBC_01500]|uniref:hypothetical protein n=1 Tax=Streptomyces sp. NBC_01500 TaxID=2903886 RepID=UPI002256DD3F|nr:hypothetical protein [Streptomyces sp. NBC_01500]MCX4554268.1 hypothetical protein [Streptomyces sp. NBC_01500]
MSNLEYAIGLVLVLVALAAVVAAPFLLAHSRTVHDHGPACWWCHPRLMPRKRR